MKSILFLAAAAMTVSSASIAAEPKKTQHGEHGSQGQKMNMPAKTMGHGKSHKKGMVMPAAKRIDNAKIRIGGGMPDHGHDLPMAPNMSKNLGGGKYLVEGIKFNMAGWRQVRFDTHAQHHKGKVAFNLVVN